MVETRESALKSMENALDIVISELSHDQDHFRQNHPPLFRAFDIMQIYMEIGPNRSTVMGRALDEITPEIMNNREHYEREHPKILHAIDTLATEKSDLSHLRRIRHEVERKKRRKETPVRGRRSRNTSGKIAH